MLDTIPVARGGRRPFASYALETPGLMARLLGFIGNRPDHAMAVLRAHADVLRCQPPAGSSVGWGMGFFQNGEVLLRRRPSDDRPLVDPIESGIEMRTDAAIGLVRVAPTGTLRTEDTQPFRYRSWLYAQSGAVHGFDRLGPSLNEAVAAFLRPNVRGDTDAELCFYLFLTFLHQAGGLDAPRIDPISVSASLRASLSLVDHLSAAEGYPPADLDLVTSDGEHLFAVHRSGGMAYRTFDGGHDVARLLSGEAPLVARPPRIDQARYTVIASPVAPATRAWTTLPSRVIFTAARDAPPSFEPI